MVSVKMCLKNVVYAKRKFGLFNLFRKTIKLPNKVAKCLGYDL